MNEFIEQAFDNPTISQYIADKDAGWISDALIDEGLIEIGDGLVVSFVPDKSLTADAPPSYAKVYSAYRNEDGKMVPLELIDVFELDIGYDRDN